MEKISQLMDGELGERETRLQIRRLGSDASLVQAWDTYHLIRDALRDDICVGSDFERRLRQRLDGEPTLIAPHVHFASRVVRYSLPLAAAVAGVAVVGWLALTAQLQPAPSPTAIGSAPSVVATKTERPVPPAPAPAGGQMNDYLLAHQEFSPTAAMQGVASYVRTVSNEDWDPAR
jgi:sigma-E factor negative regulatory protein RseA